MLLWGQGPGRIQHRLRASNRSHLLHHQKPAASRGGARAAARSSAVVLISGINDPPAEGAGSGEPGVLSHSAPQQVPYDLSHHRAESHRDPAKLVQQPLLIQQREILGVQRNKNCLFYSFQLCAGSGGGRWISVVRPDNPETKPTSNQEPLPTFDPFSLRANPTFFFLFLNWNREISWLRSLAGRQRAQNLNPLQQLGAERRDNAVKPSAAGNKRNKSLRRKEQSAAQPVPLRFSSKRFRFWAV